jgi:hypothetical protein
LFGVEWLGVARQGIRSLPRRLPDARKTTSMRHIYFKRVTRGSNGDVRSCIQCGQHKLRNRGAIHRFLGGLMYFCFDCRPPKPVQ